MAKEGYKNYEELVQKTYNGTKTVRFRTDKALKQARDALRRLNQEIATCYAEEAKEGYKGIGQKPLESLKARYKECLDAVDRARKKESTTDILNTIYQVLKDDSVTVNTLSEYDSFPEYFRRDIVAFEDMSVQPVGGALSQRIPVQFTDDEGKEIKGFFTKESRFQIQKLDDILMELARQEDEKYACGQLLENLVKNKQFCSAMQKIEAGDQAFRDYFYSVRVGVRDGQQIGMTAEEKNAVEIQEWKAFFVEQKLSPDLIPDKWGQGEKGNLTDIITNFAENYLTMEGINKLQNNQNTKKYLYEIINVEQNDNITDRNCAMTEVAKLLGKEQILAGAKRMEIRVGGKKQKGIFMETANGKDEGGVIDDPGLHLEQIKPSALQDIADLQMIDYICGNIDRHRGNMCYQFDDKGNLIHIQGIDNDLSMGEIELEGGTGWLPKVENMKVISEEMAAKIQQMEKEDLQTMLVELDLPDRQKDAAWKRIQYMKEALRNAKTLSDEDLPNSSMFDGIKIVPKEMWEKIKPEHLVPPFDMDEYFQKETAYKKSRVQAENIEQPTENYNKAQQEFNKARLEFRRAREMFDNGRRYNIFADAYYSGQLFKRVEREKRNEEEAEQSYNKGELVSSSFRPGVLQKEKSTMEDIQSRLEQTVGDSLNKRGKEFKELYQSVQDLTAWYQNNQGKTVDGKEKEKFKKLCKEMVEHCNRYIDSHNPYTTMGKKRQKIAIELLGFMGSKGIQIDEYAQQQKNQKDKAIEELSNMAAAEKLSGANQIKAMRLMAAVIKIDQQNDIAMETIKEKITFGKDKLPEALTSEDIGTFIKQEKEMVEAEQVRLAQQPEENSRVSENEEKSREKQRDSKLSI